MPKEDIDLKKQVLTLFVLFFPTLIITAVPNSISGNWLPLVIKILLAFYQFVVLKNFIDTYYS
jgi:hypothetical protein